MNVPDDFAEVIRTEFAEVGFDDVTVIGGNRPSVTPNAWVRLVQSNKREHGKRDGENLLSASVAVSLSGDEDTPPETLHDLLVERARNAAHTLRELLDSAPRKKSPAN